MARKNGFMAGRAGGLFFLEAGQSMKPPPKAPPPKAPPVVLVHGLALSHRYMMPTGRLLAQRSFRVLAPDLPGFGASIKPPCVLDVPALADALADWLRLMALPPVLLLGNSFACQIIIDLASRYPGLVAATLLQGPTTPPGERTWLAQFFRWRQNAPYNPPEMEAIADGDYHACGYGRALATFRASLKDRPEDKLAAIQAPSLVVRGARDPICHEWWAEKVAFGLPNGTMAVIPGVAHTLVYTAPVELSGLAEMMMDSL